MYTICSGMQLANCPDKSKDHGPRPTHSIPSGAVRSNRNADYLPGNWWQIIALRCQRRVITYDESPDLIGGPSLVLSRAKIPKNTKPVARSCPRSRL